MESRCRMTSSPKVEEPLLRLITDDTGSLPKTRLFSPSPSSPPPALTDSPVVQCGIIDPALRLLNLAFEVDSSFGGSAVGHSPIGFGLQILQGRGHLFSQCSGFWGISFPPAEKTTHRHYLHGDDIIADTNTNGCQIANDYY